MRTTDVLEVDPICGMKVDPETAKFSSVKEGKTYYFCGAGCKKKFDAPAALTQISLTSAAASAPAAAPDKAEYTCPMHPEIRQQGPGSCPICGMALDAVEITAEEENHPELVDMTRRFWICAALTLPLLAGMLFHNKYSAWIDLAFATPVVMWEENRSSSAAGPRS